MLRRVALSIHGERSRFNFRHYCRRFTASSTNGSYFGPSAVCPFKVLGLPPSASKDDVREKYLTMAKKHHPDVGGDEKEFKKINDAYQECNERIETGFRTREHVEYPGAPEEEASKDFRRKTDEPPDSDAPPWTADGTESHERYRRAARERHQRAHDQLKHEYISRFATAQTSAELNEAFHDAMKSGAFVGYDRGEPLFHALRRYHHVLGSIGESHVACCFDIMSAWEAYTHHTPASHYYHVLLQLYTNDIEISRYGIDAMTATEIVMNIMQRMKDRGIEDESAINWWETLRLALMQRSDSPQW